jgi:VWFA-related protein
VKRPDPILPRARAGWLALAALVLGAGAPSGQAPARSQDPQRPTFRLEANFVRVDIYPTAGGSPVTDLTQADFELLEDGVPQKIETFERVLIPGHTPVEQRRDPGTVAQMRAEAENPRARLFVIFLDPGHTEIAGSHRMQRSLVTMLDRMLSPDDLFAVMTPQMAASDIALARKSETVEGYLRRHWTWGQQNRLVSDDPIEHRYDMCYPPPAGQRHSAIAGEMIARRREAFAINALQDLSVYLRGLREERKAVIAVTNGWLLPRENAALAGPGPQPNQLGTTPAGRISVDPTRSQYGESLADCERDRQTLAYTDLFQEFLDLMDAANRGNVSIYPVASRGLAAFDSSIENQTADLSSDMRRARSRVESLRTLAENTDGIPVVDTNDIDRGLTRIVADMTSYYLVGYYSSNTKPDGRFRKITVRVTRPGVEVRARRGYKAATPEELGPPAGAGPATAAAGPPAAVQAAIAALGAMRPAQVRTLVATARPGGDAGPLRLWATVELDAQAARGDFAGGGDIAIIVAGGDGSVLTQGRGSIPAGARTAVVDLGDVAAAPGEIGVRTRIKPRGDGTAVSDIATVAVAAGAGQALLARRGPSTGMKFVPTADRRFSRADRLRAEVAIADPASTVTAVLLDRAGGELAVPVATSTRTEGRTHWASAEIALAPLAPADYVLKMTVTGPGGATDVYTGVKVVP